MCFGFVYIHRKKKSRAREHIEIPKQLVSKADPASMDVICAKTLFRARRSFDRSKVLSIEFDISGLSGRG